MIVYTGKTEMGQNIRTSLAQAVAEARTPVQGMVDPPPQYAPLSQQAQPPMTNYNQPPPRHGAPGQ